MSVCPSRLPRRHHRRTINVARQYLGRALDQNGYVLDIHTQRQRDTAAAKKFSRKLPKGLGYMPRVVTDKLKSSGAALRYLLPGVEHRQHRYLKNRVENSRQLTRQREWHRQGFKSPGQAQRFLASYVSIVQHFRPRCRRFWAAEYRREMTQRFEPWWEIRGTPMTV
jgi:putative transposase